MKKNLLFLSVFMLFAFSSFGTIHTVQVSDNVFTPASFTMKIGDTVRWVWMSGTHTTTSTTVPAGAAAWDNPMTSTATSFTYVPTVIGSYSYRCTIHASMGMTASFTVISTANVRTIGTVSMFSISPNPVSSTLHMMFSNNGLPISVSLIDMAGRRVLVKEFNGLKEADLDLQGIPCGSYILKAAQDTEAYAQKVDVIH